jgi:hypothetical protein
MFWHLRCPHSAALSNALALAATTAAEARARLPGEITARVTTIAHLPAAGAGVSIDGTFDPTDFDECGSTRSQSSLTPDQRAGCAEREGQPATKSRRYKIAAFAGRVCCSPVLARRRTWLRTTTRR